MCCVSAFHCGAEIISSLDILLDLINSCMKNYLKMGNISSVGVEKEDMLWTEKYQPQDSSELVGNKKEIERLHRSEVGDGSVFKITLNILLLDYTRSEVSCFTLCWNSPYRVYVCGLCFDLLPKSCRNKLSVGVKDLLVTVSFTAIPL